LTAVERAMALIGIIMLKNRIEIALINGFIFLPRYKYVGKGHSTTD